MLSPPSVTTILSNESKSLFIFSSMDPCDRMSTPFISIDGLAGDVVIVKEVVQKREVTISSLEKELKRLDTSHEKEAKKIYTKQKTAQNAIERQIQALQQQLEQRLVASRETTGEEIAMLDDTYKAREKLYLKRIKALQVLNTLDRGRIAPIRKLPAELLGYSFQHYVDLGQSPWLLTMVSKSWKQTAITTPGLWVHISLAQSESYCTWKFDGKNWSSTGNRVICRDLDDLNVITRYAGTLALDVTIPWHSIRDHSFNLFQLILDGGAISQRLGSLTIERGRSEFGSKTQLKIGVFPNLHTISLHYLPPGMNPTIFETTSTSMPRLRHFKMHSSITFPRDSNMWKRLQTLDLGMHLSSLSLNNIFPHLTLVEELRGCPRDWPDPYTPKVKLEHLKVLDVTCDHIFLSRLLLEAPFLEQLTVDDVTPRRFGLSNQYSPGETLSLPTLTTFNAKSEDPNVWLSRLSAPLLRTIGLRGKVRLLSFENMYFSNVQSFSLDAPCSDEVLISALRCVPNAKEILLAPGPTREGLWGLATLQALAKEPDEICPQMDTFRLGTTDHHIQLSKTLANPWIRKIIKARAEIGSFEVHWSLRGGKGGSVQYAG